MILFRNKLFSPQDYFTLFESLEQSNSIILFISHQIRQFPCDVVTKSSILLFVLCYYYSHDKFDSIDKIFYYKQWCCNQFSNNNYVHTFQSNDFLIVTLENYSSTCKKGIFFNYIPKNSNLFITSIEDLEQFKTKQEIQLEESFLELISSDSSIDTIVMNTYHEMICYYCKKYNKNYLQVKQFSFDSNTPFEFGIENNRMILNKRTENQQEAKHDLQESKWTELFYYSWFQKYLSFIRLFQHEFDHHACYWLSWDLILLIQNAQVI